MKIPDYNKKIKHPTYLELQEEIKRLKEEYMILQNASDEVEEKLQARIDKAIEYLTKCNYNDLKFTNRTYDILLNILKGVDKE